jgi:hypothetical protein
MNKIVHIFLNNFPHVPNKLRPKPSINQPNNDFSVDLARFFTTIILIVMVLPHQIQTIPSLNIRGF